MGMKFEAGWYARCDGVKWCGPYPSRALAVRAIMQADGTPAPGAFVWAVDEQGRAFG